MDGIGSSAAEVVGFKTLKPLLHEVIRAFITGNDVFVYLPRGMANLCFVLLPLMFNCILEKAACLAHVAHITGSQDTMNLWS